MSLGRGAVTGLPATITEPDVGLSIPPMWASSVDLPQPEGPSRQTNSPWRMSSDTLSRAWTFCDASRPAKTIDTRSIAMAVGALAVLETIIWDGSGRRNGKSVTSSVTSEFHGDEFVVMDDFRLRNEVEDFKFLQRIADDIEGSHIPGAIGREAADLRVIDLRDN